MSSDLEQAGALVTAGLAAGEVDRASWGRHGGAHAARHCGDCGTELNGAYCHACGQSAHLHRSLLHLTEEVLHGVLHFDAKGWRTLPLLIDGQRTRYVSPLALFLFNVFLMFFVYSMMGDGDASTGITGAQRAEVEADLAQSVADAKADVARATAALEQARRNGGDVSDAEAELAAAQTAQRVVETTTRSVDAATTRGAFDSWQKQVAALKVHTGSASLDAKLQHQLSNPELFLYRLKNAAYKFSFMLIPISLPFLWLLFVGRRGIAMYDHAVFSLYSLSFMSLLFITTALLSRVGLHSLAGLMVIFVPPIHMFVDLRDTYRLGTFAALWRTAALLCVAGTAFALFVAFIVMMTLH
jgi:hypothetical protein